MSNKNKRFESNKKYFTICIYVVVTFVVCLFIYKFISNWEETTARIASIVSMLAPFLLAFLVVYFVTPMVKHIDRLLFRNFRNERFTKIHKAISLVIAYILIIGLMVLTVRFVVPQILSSISELINQSASYYDYFERNFNTFATNHPNIDLGVLHKFTQDNLPKLLDYAKDYMTDLIPMIYSASVSVIGWLINIVLAFVISCYLIWNQKEMTLSVKRLIYAFFSERNSQRIIRTIKECNKIFSQYIIGKALDSLIIGVLCFICMCILDMPYALVISVFVGITNMIPYFGPFIGAVPGAVLLLIIDPKKCIIFILMIFLLQQFDGAILGPKILGNSTGLQPIWVIFAILAGSYVAGVLGMFVGVPVVAVLAHLLNKVVEYMLNKKQLNINLTSKQNNVVPRMSDEEIGFSYDDEN